MRTALASFLAFALSAALAATRALPRVEGHGQARSAGGHPAVRLQPDGDRAESRSHRKGLWLAAGETLVVRVQQEGTDVSLRLLGPGQEELARADSPTAGWGREELWWTAASPGLYSLEIQSDEPAPWRYRPDVERHTARAEDRLRAQAFGLYLEAEKRRRGEAPGPPGPLYQEAAARFREAGEGRAAGLAEQRQATLAAAAGETAEAARRWREAAAAYGRGGAEREEAVALEKEGQLLAEELDRFAEARAPLERSLAFWQRLGDASTADGAEAKEHRANTLYQLGRVEWGQGRTVPAIERFRAAAGLWQDAAKPAPRAIALAELSQVYLWLRHLELAGEALAEAEPAARASGDGATLRLVLGQLGTLRRRQGDLPASESALREALALAEKGQDAEAAAWAENDLAQTLFLAGERAEARRRVERALSRLPATGSAQLEAYLRMNLGWMLERSGEAAAGLPQLERAVALHRELADDRDLPGALWGLGRALAKLGRLGAARAAAAEAVERAEGARRGLPGEAARGAFLGDRQRYYELLVSLEMSLEKARPGRGWARKALLSAERGRARLLRDALAALEPGERPEPGAGARVAELEGERDRLAQRRLALRAAGAGSAEIAALEGRLLSLGRELEEARAHSPGPATSEAPAEAELAAAEAGLGRGAVALFYSVGEERSFLWRLAGGKLAAYELAPKAEIEAAVRALDLRLGGKLETRPEDLEEAARQVARRVLWPAGRLPPGRLIVVADGPLHYVPFELLPAGPGPADGRLADRHEVQLAPSLALWARGLGAGRGEVAAESESLRVAVIANPLYRRDDPRLASSDTRGLPAPLAQASGFSQDWLASLPATGREARAILSRLPPERRLEWTGANASVENVLSGQLESASIVHFAVHGLLDTTHPELSGLALSLYDPEGRPRDGILWAHRLRELRLRADLVVLSACSTALGKELRGEGLLSLAHGFLAAGARQVLVTLWDVGDDATARLMERFYAELLDGHRPPAEALAAAQRALAAEPSTAHPYHWAGFVLLGGGW